MTTREQDIIIDEIATDHGRAHVRPWVQGRVIVTTPTGFAWEVREDGRARTTGPTLGIDWSYE